MREDITSIPISEVFEPKDGCPICRLRDMLENRVVEYITGAAMMEPDVRIETNEQGFCFTHYQMMLKKRNRLSVALMMESHLDELERQVFGKEGLFGKGAQKQGKSASAATESCFICHQIEHNMEKMLANTCRLWENERDFRQLFEQQTALCLPHFSMLSESASRNMNKKNIPDFTKVASNLCRAYLKELRGDVSHFCKMFDYRNNGADADWGNSKDSIERAIWWLTTREPNA